MHNTPFVLFANAFLGGQMAIEQGHIDHIFIGLPWREFGGIDRELVSLQRYVSCPRDRCYLDTKWERR